MESLSEFGGMVEPGIVSIEGKILKTNFKSIFLTELKIRTIPSEINSFQEAKVRRNYSRLSIYPETRFK